MDIKCGIYAIVSPSGVAYIGSSKDILQRKYQHTYRLKRNCHWCKPLQLSWNKNKFLKFEIIEICHEEKLIEREQFWIDNHLNKYSGIYNNNLLADRIVYTSEVREKMAFAKRGKKQSAETIRKRVEKNTGKKRTSEIVEKIAQANRGKKRTLESRRRMSEAMKASYARRGY